MMQDRMKLMCQRNQEVMAQREQRLQALRDQNKEAIARAELCREIFNQLHSNQP